MAAPDPSPDEAAVVPVRVPRARLLQRLAEHPEPFEAGERVWRCSEPWILSLASLAQDPSVLLAELLDWASLLDIHSIVRVEAAGDDTEIVWTNHAGVAPDARECAFRLGALSSLLRSCAGDEVVAVEHIECAARRAPLCRYVVEDWIPCRDSRHERVLRESVLLARALAAQQDPQPGSAPLLFDAPPSTRGTQRARRFMDEVEDIIMVFDKNLDLVDTNRAAARFFGMTREELRGQSAKSLLDESSHERLRETVPLLFEQGARRGLEFEARTRRGWATIEVSARAAFRGRSFVCIARDVTERLRLEHELEERNAQLREQNERIAEADRLKSEFLANVTHELSTPLTCIKGFAKLLRTDELTGREGLEPLRRLEFLQIMESEAGRMSEIIKGLLELSNIQSGGGTLDRSPVSLNTIVAESLKLLQHRLDESGLQLEQKLDQELPLAWLDRDKMKQVALNLLDNAIKFSPPGAAVLIRTEARGGVVRLHVRNGCFELEPGDLERIFARFRQRDGSFTRRHGGVGLGLDLCRAIVELHDGRIWAELPVAEEVEFIAELPIGQAPAGNF